MLNFVLHCWFCYGYLSQILWKRQGFITKWLFWFGAPVKERSATSSILGKNKIGIVAIKLSSMKNFKDYVTNPVCVCAFFFQNRVFHLFNYCAEQRTYFRAYIIYLCYGQTCLYMICKKGKPLSLSVEQSWSQRKAFIQQMFEVASFDPMLLKIQLTFETFPIAL